MRILKENKINDIHINRFEKLVDFIEQKEEKTFELQRSEISNIVGVSEGDSLKKIFKILNENKELYNEKFLYKKEKRKHLFMKVDKKIICNDIEVACDENIQNKEIINEVVNENKNKVVNEDKTILNNKEIINNENINKDIYLLNSMLEIEVNNCISIINKIRRKSKEDYSFCKKEFKDEFDFIELYLKATKKNINLFDNEKDIVNILKEKIDKMYMTSNYLRLYHCIS